MTPVRLFALSALSLCMVAPQVRAQQAAPMLQQHPLDEEPAEQPGWSNNIRAMLNAGQFDALDRMADKFRRERTRMPGGGWRLHHFYAALDIPFRSDADSAQHIAQLRKWMAERPESMTAPIALATSLHRWAWVARGNGMANTVTPDRWKLFEDRHAQALEVLEAARRRSAQDPQFWAEKMNVDLSQNASNEQMREDMERGLQVEPEFYYLQLKYANYLLPKWNGQPGDSSRFVKEQADKLGGDRGDALYFQLATVLIKRGDAGFPVQELDWQRIQSGFRAISLQFGVTNEMQNQLAFMAYKYRDADVARAQFTVIGNDWARGVWRDRAFFDRIRDWSHGLNG